MLSYILEKDFSKVEVIGDTLVKVRKWKCFLRESHRVVILFEEIVQEFTLGNLENWTRG